MAWHRLMGRVMASGLVRPDLADKTLISSPHHHHHHHHHHNHHQAFKHRRLARTLPKPFLLTGSVCEDIISRGDTSVNDPVGFSTNCSFATSNHGDLESIAILVDEQCVDLLFQQKLTSREARMNRPRPRRKQTRVYIRSKTNDVSSNLLIPSG